jgi:hypothetical protein
MSEPTDHQSCPACNAWWRLPLSLAIVLAAIVFMLRRNAPEPAAQPLETPNQAIAASASAESVQLTINFGDDRSPTEVETRWHDGMTVADLLNADSNINFASTGSEQSEMLTSLGGLANEGGRGRNWTYRVNGKYADRSFAVYELQPGDQVLWTFGAQE